MLIRTTRMYRRVLDGLDSPDEHTRDMAETCLSYFVCHLRLKFIVLPDYVAAAYNQLPEGNKYERRDN